MERMPVTTHDTLEPPATHPAESVRATEPSKEVEQQQHVPENPSLAGIPQEVLCAIGIYDTDCAGGCG
jgi:hypothetical protein